MTISLSSKYYHPSDFLCRGTVDSAIEHVKATLSTIQHSIISDSAVKEVSTSCLCHEKNSLTLLVKDSVVWSIQSSMLICAVVSFMSSKNEDIRLKARSRVVWQAAKRYVFAESIVLS